MVTGTNHEQRRIADLRSFEILDTPAEDKYDHIVALAKLIADTPAAYITFIDTERLWFKSVVGLPDQDIPRERTFCQFVVETESYLLIEDSWNDPRFLVSANGTVRRRDCEICDPLDPLRSDEGGDSAERGAIRFYLGVPLRSSEGSVLGTLCVADFEPRDADATVIGAMEKLAEQVTALLELRRTNVALEAERETFTTLFEVAPVPLVLLEEGVIRRANHVFAAAVTDGDTAGLNGTPLSRFLRDLPGNSDDPMETELKNEVGGVLPVNVYATRMKIQESSYQLIALYDISDRKEKEQVLRDQRTQAENATRIKDTFLSLVSHDLKSPLSGIYAMLELLEKAGETFSKEDRDEAIRDLHSSVALMMEMINQLLNIHRLESGQLQADLTRSEIRPIAQDILLGLSRQISDKRLTVRNEIDPAFAAIVDEALFREALFNLVSNAVKFSPPGRTVLIEARSSETGQDQILVTDQGGGIPPEDLPNLFRQEIKTSRPGTAGEGGTGLGLPLVRDIMHAHGGDVSVVYTGFEGSCFMLELPGKTSGTAARTGEDS
jgi:signal transduction histidine kinase